MPPKIDKGEYQHGFKDFRDGKTLRDLVQAAHDDEDRARKAHEDSKGSVQDNWQERESRSFSRFLGFADGLIAKLRSL